MARKQATEEPEPEELEESLDASSESDASDDDFEPEDFEAGSDDFIDSDDDAGDDDDVVATDDDEDAPLEELPSEPEDPDDDDVPLLLSKDEEFEAYDEDDDDVEVEGLREGEFICADCSMVFRLTALADPKAMLCRDCV